MKKNGKKKRGIEVASRQIDRTNLAAAPVGGLTKTFAHPGVKRIHGPREKEGKRKK